MKGEYCRMNTSRSGIAQRSPFTYDELVKEYDKQVAALEKRWGEGYFYPVQARKAFDKYLNRFKCGEVVEVYSSNYIEDGNSFDDVMMSDGTVKTICYGYWD